MINQIRYTKIVFFMTLGAGVYVLVFIFIIQPFMAFIQLQAMTSQQSILSLPFYRGLVCHAEQRNPFCLYLSTGAWFATLSNEIKALLIIY